MIMPYTTKIFFLCSTGNIFYHTMFLQEVGMGGLLNRGTVGKKNLAEPLTLPYPKHTLRCLCIERG